MKIKTENISKSKGFAKIFEAIIASVILLASLTFFFVPDVRGSGWDETSLQLLSQDVLQSAYLNGSLARYVKTDNTTEFIAMISSMLPKTVDFSIEVKGIPNSVIYLVCADCSAGQASELTDIFNKTDFQYKNRNISIRIDDVDLLTEPLPADTNMLFFFDKAKIAQHEVKINESLAKGISVFLLSDLVQADVEGRIGKMFNLTWVGTSGQPGRFDDVLNASKVSHYAARYYANLSGKYIYDVQAESFTAFNPSGVRAESDASDVIKTDSGRAHVRAKQGTGRTLWFSDYNRASHQNPNTIAADRLVKSAVMWASGERFKLDLIKKNPAPVHFKSTIFVHDEDTYSVELTIWRIFF
ncbi:MAG: hypothetical protein HY517_02860 [Candidatus Aenigmarchaeota archaeon]|nr:hypothetical protein [Candidatus Aenigmarchaeota archaeon]